MAIENEGQSITHRTIQISLPPCVVVVQLWLQHDEDITDTEHSDTL